MTYLPIIITVAAVIIILMFISKFNDLKRRRNQIENASSSLDALFIKRSDLIPNLVSVVKKYTDYEGDLLERITRLHQPQKGTADFANGNETEKLLKLLMIQVENYPELKANQQFNNLQYSLNECEEQIAAGRRYLSTSITQFNNSVTTFPSNLVAGIFGMSAYEWQRATEQQRQNVNVGDLLK